LSKSIIEESIKKNIFHFILIAKYIEYVSSDNFLWNNLPFYVIIFYLHLNMFILLMKKFISFLIPQI